MEWIGAPCPWLSCVLLLVDPGPARSGLLGALTGLMLNAMMPNFIWFIDSNTCIWHEILKAQKISSLFL